MTYSPPPASFSMRPPILLVAAGLLVVTSAEAQLVTPRTVPVFQDEQFQIYPSSRPGLGGITIAIDDTLGDPFTNPAKAMRLRATSITTAPYSHGISGNRGGGRTLPIALLAGGDEWAGGVLGAFQQIDRAGPIWNRPTSERTATNQYITGILARSLGAGMAVGVSAFHADLAAVDGVDLLYAGSDRIDQSGSLTDVRVGAMKEWAPGHVLELLALHNSTSMRHDVHFTTSVWDQATQRLNVTQRQDVNLDQTNIWGIHSEYTRPVGVEGWRIGALATANHLSHPKIPNYVLQNLPRDPGATVAFNFGFGAARDTGPFTFGVDVVLEPMTSDTYADAAGDVKRTDGTVIVAGQKTVENHFQFHNTKAALGVGRKWVTDSAAGNSLTVDFGLSMYSINYDLRQTSNITRVTRFQHENWVESGPTFGIRYRTPTMAADRRCSPSRSGPASSGGMPAIPTSPRHCAWISARCRRC